MRRQLVLWDTTRRLEHGNVILVLQVTSVLTRPPRRLVLQDPTHWEVPPSVQPVIPVCSDMSVVQRQTAVTAYLKSKQLLLFAFASRISSNDLL